MIIKSRIPLQYKYIFIFIGIYIISTILSCHALSAAEEKLSGRKIIQKQVDLHSLNSSRIKTVMILVDKKKRQKKRIVESYLIRDSTGKKSLMVFRDPADVKNTALLSKEIDKATRQWVYLPALKKLQNLADSGQGNYFMGTDFTYGDLKADNMNNYNYELIDSETVEEQDCYVIDIIPISREIAKNTGYSKRVSWVRKDIYFTIKTQFFGKNQKMIKESLSKELINVHSTAWMAKKVLVDNKKARHKTLMGVVDYEVNIPIADKIFTEKNIKAGSIR